MWLSATLLRYINNVCKINNHIYLSTKLNCIENLLEPALLLNKHCISLFCYLIVFAQMPFETFHTEHLSGGRCIITQCSGDAIRPGSRPQCPNSPFRPADLNYTVGRARAATLLPSCRLLFGHPLQSQVPNCKTK